MPEREIDRGTVTIDRNGRTETGDYVVLLEKGIRTLTVSTMTLGVKSAGLGQMPPQALARMLLRELVEDSERCK